MIYLLLVPLWLFISTTLLLAVSWKFGTLLFLLWHLFFIE